jgi:hypothetical protein
LSGATTSWENRPNLEIAFRPLGHDFGPPAYFRNFDFVVLLGLHSVEIHQDCCFHQFSTCAGTSSKHRPNLESAFRPLGHNLGDRPIFKIFYFGVLLSLHGRKIRLKCCFIDFCLLPALAQNIGPIYNRPFGHSGMISGFRPIF